MIDFDSLAREIDLADFDHPFVIDGELINDAPEQVYAPSVYHDDHDDIMIDGSGWEAVSGGMTGQYGYRGPVLHPSEYVGQGIAQALVEDHEPGTIFVLVVVNVLPDGEDDDPEPAGWVILKHVGQH